MPRQTSPTGPLGIRPEQFRSFEERSLEVYAAEVASTLSAVVAPSGAALVEPSTKDFALAQLQRAAHHGLHRKDEGMAFTLCALLYGRGFDDRMSQVPAILADRNYDRSVLLTRLAMDRLEREALVP